MKYLENVSCPNGDSQAFFLRKKVTVPILAFMYFLQVQNIFAQKIDSKIKELDGVGVVEKLNEKIPENLRFVDHSGKKVQIKDYLQSDKPIVFSLVYFECPMLCTLVLNGMADVINRSKYKPGKDYRLLSVSIDHEETWQLAQEKQAIYSKEIGLEGDTDAWTFLTGDEESIKTLANAVGFSFKFDPKSQEYLHQAAFMVLTAKGVLSRYFYNVLHKKRNFELALTEAGQGKTGSAFDKFLLYCYRYDPDANSYVLFAFRLMRAGALLTILFLFFILKAFWRRERQDAM